MLHPARAIPYKELHDGLMGAVAAGNVSTKREGELALFTYTRSCVYDNAWDDFSLMARGLILNEKREQVIATPFPKFFNVGERDEPIPDQPFETFEKLDGSLIIAFWGGFEWCTATKGSFSSEQALWANLQLRKLRTSGLLRETTFLFEAIYPENRIVIRYLEPKLVLLAAYDDFGYEYPYNELLYNAEAMGCELAKRHEYASVSELLEKAETLPGDEEGFVLRFKDGHRLKVKGAEYRRLHALIHRVTPLALWEAMRSGDDLKKFRKDLPEEFWEDFDRIEGKLSAGYTGLLTEMTKILIKLQDKSDKEVGLALKDYPPELRRLIFPLRRHSVSDPKTQRLLYQQIRPTGNRLAGYEPSYAINRAQEEAE